MPRLVPVGVGSDLSLCSTAWRTFEQVCCECFRALDQKLSYENERVGVGGRKRT